jgi:hypothetical protein
MLEILFRNFQLLVRCGLLHQLPVTEISDPFCHSVDPNSPQREYSVDAEKIHGFIFYDIIDEFLKLGVVF